MIGIIRRKKWTLVKGLTAGGSAKINKKDVNH